MKIKDILAHLEQIFPLKYQEEFDNCGVQCGNTNYECTGALVCFEMSDETIDEALRCGANLVISHHPLILRKGIQKIEPTNRVGRIICQALENKMVLYSMHTNIDSAPGGINDLFAEKLCLQDKKVLVPQNAGLRKISVFVPHTHTNQVKESLFDAGCGNIGNYSHCAYTLSGRGSFMANEQANPFIGEAGKLELVEEERVEMVFPRELQNRVISALYASHPYEEPAYDIYDLANPSAAVGLGRIGNLPETTDAKDFLLSLKKIFEVDAIRYYGDLSKPIRRVAVCGGGGSSFISNALAGKADAYVCGDIKYHDFHTADSKMLIADIGHLESEVFVKEIIFNELKKKFTNFAVSFSKSEKMRIGII